MRRQVGCAACVVAIWGIAPVQAQADTTIGAETLAVAPTVGAVRADGAAAGGQVLALYSTGSATGTFATTGAIAHLSVTARGTQCDGAPNLVVSVDGSPVLSAGIPSTSYGE